MTPQVAQDREQGRDAVAELVRAFSDGISYYKSADFDETSARQRFIDPLFAALGWDVSDEARRGPYADVVLEQSLRRPPEGQLVLQEQEEAEDVRVARALAGNIDAGPIGVRRPDYAFRVGGDLRFFVEAKRPSVDVNSPRPIFQVKSYGYSARTPIALLTDFEELVAFDCRFPPELDEPNTGLLTEFQMRFTDYIDRWDSLWETFSHEAVAGGSLERYAATLEERRGQLPVDRAFLADLGRWRREIAQDFAARNVHLDVWQLSDATQLTLDRLVFVRVCEDRRLEDHDVLKPLLTHDDPYPAFLSAIQPMRAAYNGGLLDPDLADDLELGADVFRRVLRGLYAPWSPYRFDVLGVEILGSIYERALGSEVLLDQDRSVSIELKPEVRRAGGVYYTPQWVVDEVVRLTIDPLIEGKPPRALRNFRVLDPACGSGSFLLGAYARLIRHYEDYYTAHPTVDSRSHAADDQGVRRLTAEAKAELLRNSIFGVDVDPAAVEVTTMSLYLKSLESDSPALLRMQMRFGYALLPSLYSNIRVGNSLVSTDFYAQTALRALDEYEEHRLRPFKWESDAEGFGAILADGGFDAVVGNPPYFSVDNAYGAGHPVPAYLQRAYPAVWDRMTDVYYYFLAKAVHLAKERVGFIVSRAFLEAHYAKGVRRVLSREARLDDIVDFDGFQVFPDAGIATAIVTFDATQAHGDATVRVRKLDRATYPTREVVRGMRVASEPFGVYDHPIALDEHPWHFPSAREAELFHIMDRAGQPLRSLCELGQGMQTGANGVFASFSDDDIAELGFPDDLLKRRGRNSDIEAFYIRPDGPWALYVEEVPSYEDLPETVRAYLERDDVREKLQARAAYRRGNCEWWRWTWPLHRELHDRPRIVNPYRTPNNRFAIDWDFEFFTSTDTTVGFPFEHVGEDIRYIVGLLNSRVLTCRFRGMAKLTSPNMWEAFDNSIARLPIRRLDLSNAHERAIHDRVVRLVEGIEDARRAARDSGAAADRTIAARRAEGLSDELDEIALDLYGITAAPDRTDVLGFGAPL